MRDFAAAPRKLKAYLQQYCATTQLDMGDEAQALLWQKRWLAVPEVDEMPAADVAACLNETLLQQFDTCAPAGACSC